MNIVDAVDVANELLPRRWRRVLALGLIGAFFAFPNAAADAVLWYAQERADRIVETVVEHTVLEPGAPRDAQVPDSPSDPTG